MAKKLKTLSPEDVRAFDRTFRAMQIQAYRWDLWAAAYAIEGGCSNDGFTDFRTGLIALGRETGRN